MQLSLGPQWRGHLVRAADHTVAFSAHFSECWRPQHPAGCPGVWGPPLQESLQERPLPSSSLPGAGARVQLADSVSWALPPGKVIKGWALRLVALEAVKIPFVLWAGGTLAQSRALDPAAGTPIRYLVPSGNAQRIASSPSYRSWPRTLSFPYQFSHRFWMRLLPVNSFPAASQVAQW